MYSNKSQPVKLPSWSEVNKNRKRERKEWKDKSLLKKKKVEEKQSEHKNEFKEVFKVPEEISTLSLAVPGSIMENAQSAELRTYLAGQIARTACLFQVDEVIVYDDYGDEANCKKSTIEDDHGIKTMRSCCVQLARILQYLECPQYLRKHFFPLHNDLKFSGLLNPLNAPHHLSINENFEFREGIVTNKPVKPGRGSIVNVGLRQDVHIDKLLTEGFRCTVRILPGKNNSKKLKGLVVHPDTPRKETGIYWGYNVRLAKSLSHVFSQCPYKAGYDLSIGTSDKGSCIDEFNCPSYKHMLVMFGGVQGLEFGLENDTNLKEEDPSLLFDYYLNTLPNQGSKTIRTEEAILISLAGLRPKLNPQFPIITFKNPDSSADSKMDPDNNADSKIDSTCNKRPVIAEDDLSKFD